MAVPSLAPAPQTTGIVSSSLTYAVEIAVGLACLLAAPGAWRRAPWLGGLLAVAGVAALGHGVLALVT